MYIGYIVDGNDSQQADEENGKEVGGDANLFECKEQRDTENTTYENENKDAAGQ